MIRLIILTPNGVFLDKEVERFVVPAVKGPLEISGGYTPIIAALNECGVMKITMGKPQYYAVFQGTLKVEDGRAFVMCNEIEDGYSIDMARAIASRDRALDRIQKMEEGIDIKRAKASLARAIARISAKTLDEGMEG